VIYSDGLTTARPDLFNDPETVAAHVKLDDSAGATAQALVDLATGQGPLPDDLTVVVVRRTPSPAA
jgi:serine/threonine protein phosphatase PrpC